MGSKCEIQTLEDRVGKGEGTEEAKGKEPISFFFCWCHCGIVPPRICTLGPHPLVVDLDPQSQLISGYGPPLAELDPLIKAKISFSRGNLFEQGTIFKLIT